MAKAKYKDEKPEDKNQGKLDFSEPTYRTDPDYTGPADPAYPNPSDPTRPNPANEPIDDDGDDEGDDEVVIKFDENGLPLDKNGVPHIPLHEDGSPFTLDEMDAIRGRAGARRAEGLTEAEKAERRAFRRASRKADKLANEKLAAYDALDDKFADGTEVEEEPPLVSEQTKAEMAAGREALKRNAATPVDNAALDEAAAANAAATTKDDTVNAVTPA